jgi:hypothetical protein
MRIAGRVSLCNGIRIYQSQLRRRIGTGFAVTKQDGLGTAPRAEDPQAVVAREAGSFVVAVKTDLAQRTEPRQRNGLVAVLVLACWERPLTPSVCSAHRLLFRRRSGS